MSSIKRIFTVDGKPFYPLGGQSMNQAAYNPAEVETTINAVKALHGNTLLIPVTWELVEPEEGRFDFCVVDRLLAAARHHEIKLILLWFGTWKNGDMDYAPAWVKTDPARFQRVIGRDGAPIWVLSSHCKATGEADKKAFVELCRYLKKVDGAQRTVIGIQVENEPGIMGSDRDYGPEAQAMFEAPVPADLVDKMKAAGKGKVYELWQEAGGKLGNWTETFGAAAGELMTAYATVRYIDPIAAAGKAVYDLPLYINVWLSQAWQVPGESFPSGGATVNGIDIYRWFGPHIECAAPDIYYLDSRGHEMICGIYSREDNPFFVPESRGGGPHTWLMFRAIADYQAIGHSCFGVERILGEDGALLPEAVPYAESCRCVAAAIPLLLKYQGTDRIHSVIQEENQDYQRLELDGYVGGVFFGAQRWAKPTVESELQRGRGLVIQAGEHEFYVTGSHFCLLLRRKLSSTGGLHPSENLNYWSHPLPQHLAIEDGHFEGDTWVVDDRRNGDETSKGTWVDPARGVVRVVLTD